MRPEMILFDYGGTLLGEPGWDHERGVRALFRHVTENPHGCTPEQLSRWETDLYGSLAASRECGAEITEIQMLRLTYETHGIRLDVPYEEAELILWDGTAPMTPACVYPHAEEMLDALHLMGVRTGMISNIGWTGRALKRRVDTLLPRHHFEFILTSSDYALRKPHPALFRLALEKAGLEARKVWYCGDTAAKDVIGAHNAGIFPVLYRGILQGARREPQGEAPPVKHLEIGDWRELIAALGAKTGLQ